MIYKTKKNSLWLPHLRRHKASSVINALLGLLNVPLTLFSILAVAFAFKQLNTRSDSVLWSDLFGPIMTQKLQFLVANTPFESGMTTDQQLSVFIPVTIVVSLALFLVRFAQEFVQEQTGEQISLFLRNEIAIKYASLSFVNTEKLSIGNLAQMFSDDCREIRQTYTRLWGSVPTELILAAAHCVLLIALDPQLFLLLLAVLAPSGIVIRISGKKLKTLAKQGLGLQGELFETLLEKTKGWESVQTLGRTHRELETFEKTNETLFHVWRRSARARSAAQPFVEWLGICAGAAVLTLALRRVSDGALSTPVLTAYLVTIASLANSLQSAVGQLNSTRKGTECLKRVQAFLGPLVSERADPDQKYEPSQFIQNQNLFQIEIKNYRSHTAPSKTKSFTAKLGDIVAIVGSSGAGKSTFLKALLGLIESSEGSQILWNDHSIFDPKVRSHFCSQIALLPQESYIFAGTIFENLTYPQSLLAGDPEVWARALVALDRAKLKSRGLKESASSLSGGERQRLMFARAFFREARLWILDEATSALDIETEKLITNELIASKDQRILIMVAHRPSMIQMSHQVLNF